MLVLVVSVLMVNSIAVVVLSNLVTVSSSTLIFSIESDVSWDVGVDFDSKRSGLLVVGLVMIGVGAGVGEIVGSWGNRV